MSDDLGADFEEALAIVNAAFGDDTVSRSVPDYEAGYRAWQSFNPWWLRWLLPRTPIKAIVDAAIGSRENE